MFKVVSMEGKLSCNKTFKEVWLQRGVLDYICVECPAIPELFISLYPTTSKTSLLGIEDVFES